MIDQNRNLQVLVLAGSASQKAVGFTANESVQPFTVGTAADWQISADGVAEVHAYLFYDGQVLYVSCINPQFPVTVDGQAVAAEWMAVAPGSEILLGSAILGVEANDVSTPQAVPELETVELILPQTSPPVSQGSLDEATMLRPAPRNDVPPPAPRSMAGSAAPSKPKKLKIRQSARENPTDDEDATRFAPLDISAAPSAPISSRAP